MKTAKIFKNGQSQAVRLPKEFRFESDKVYIKKQGENVILIPTKEPWWQSLWESISLFSDDFMENREQPKEQQHRDFFE